MHLDLQNINKQWVMWKNLNFYFSRQQILDDQAIGSKNEIVIVSSLSYTSNY